MKRTYWEVAGLVGVDGTSLLLAYCCSYEQLYLTDVLFSRVEITRLFLCALDAILSCGLQTLPRLVEVSFCSCSRLRLVFSNQF